MILKMNMMKRFFLLFLFLYSTSLFAAASYQQLYDQYFSLSNALAIDSVADAKKSAQAMATTVAALLEQQTKDPESVRQSLTLLSNLSKTIANVDKLDQMRKPFEELTSLMGKLQQHAKIQADEYYCPMVKKTWLQSKDSKQVRNPYAGKSMSSCGEKKKSG